MFLFAVLAASFSAILVAPAIASAGCQAAGSGNPTYVDGSVRIISGLQCSGTIGSHYEVRTYLQGSSGGFHIVSGPQTKQFYSPTSGIHVDPYYFPCSPLTPSDSQIRSKIVVENVVTGTTDIGYSGAVTRPANCQ
jgi:hypothetical protein